MTDTWLSQANVASGTLYSLRAVGCSGVLGSYLPVTGIGVTSLIMPQCYFELNSKFKKSMANFILVNHSFPLIAPTGAVLYIIGNPKDQGFAE